MKKITSILAVVCSVSFFMCAVVILPLRFQKGNNRNLQQIKLNHELREKIRNETKDMSSEEICNYGENLTCSLLSFTTSPWLDIDKGKAHCIGYSQLCCNIINFALSTHGKEGKAKPVIGYIEWFEINIHPILKSCMPNKRLENFVKDHDFVEFECATKHILFSPTIKDLLYYDIRTEL